MTEARTEGGRSRQASAERALNEHVIVDAALRLIRRSSVEQLSMRALAKELGVSPMAIYHHVPNKDALLERVRDSVLALVPTVTATRADARKPERPLTEQDIIDAALELMRGNSEELSMRGLAKQLGVSPMAIYHHVPNKEALMERVIDSVFARVPTPEPSRRHWESQMKAYAKQGVMLMAEYPGLMRHRGMPPNAIRRLIRYGIDVLLEAGFDERTAALAIATFHSHAFSLAVLPRMAAEREPGRQRDLSKALRGDPSRAARVLRTLDDLSFSEYVEFGLDSVLAGLRAQLARSKRGESVAHEGKTRHE